MNIFISNDDGIKSNGLVKLAERLSLKNNVLVVAPDGNRSACSHSLTISNTISLDDTAFIKGCKAYSVSGTPVDCVKFAKLVFSDFDTDIVVAGINSGHNLGSDILYSGTVSIACEAAFFGHIAFAFSVYRFDEIDFEPYAVKAEQLIEFLLPYSSKDSIWNINFPACDFSEIKGVKITKLGKQIYSDEYIKVSENQYKLVGKCLSHDENDEDCDVEWINKGYITVTPILFNKTDYDKIKEVKKLCIEL